MSAAASEHTPPPLRRNRDFLILWSGQVVSTIGSEVSGLAFPLLVLGVTHSPAKAGIVGFAAALPNLFLYLPAGTIVDRVDRKRLMIVSDAARAVALGSVAVALAAGSLAYAHIVVVAFVDGAFGVFFRVAETAALPNVVPAEQLGAAIAQNQARQQGAGVVSQPLAGFLYSLARVVPFVFDTVSYAVSCVSLLFIRSEFQRPRERSVTRLRAEMVEGIVWLWRQPLLRTINFLTAGTNFAHAAFTLVLIVRAKELGASPTVIGFMFALFAAGGILGALASGWVQRTFSLRVVVIGSIWLWALETAALFFVSNVYALGAICGLEVLVGPPFNVVVGSRSYELVPDRLLGRVRSAGALVSWGVIPLGSLAAGFLVDGIGARSTFLVLAAIFVVVACVATVSRPVRAA